MRGILAAFVIVVFCATAAYASDCGMCANLNDGDIMTVCGARLCSGACNALLGWSEIFFRPGKVVAEGGNPLVGFFRGLGNAVARTVVGMVEIATFWTPGDSVVKMADCPVCAYK
jgi:putative exosortase-associated protein (TIGR04073 family)